MRKLASVRKIQEVKPIIGADSICHYRVDNWWVIDSKEKYKVGDLVVYCEPDSFLPILPQYEFLRKSSYKKLSDGTEGFRLKTIKLRGALSQGLLIPLEDSCVGLEIGTDVSEKYNITKYEPPIPACLAGVMKGNFPSFIHKTDEERVQNLTRFYDSYRDKKFIMTEKLDGSSCTMYLRDGEFGVCSRNIDLKETEGNSFWQIAKSLDVENKMRKFGMDNFAIQGELVGPGVNGNIYQLNNFDFFVFNIYDINNNVYMNHFDLQKQCVTMDIKSVPLLAYDFTLPEKLEDLIHIADGKSIINTKVSREGIVLKTPNREISFKAISNVFLLKNE